jgi:hypothetical protein
MADGKSKALNEVFPEHRAPGEKKEEDAAA